MPSRQMAFQITELEIHALLKRIAETYDLRDKEKTIGEWIDSIDPDPKVRTKLEAVLVISIKCQKEGKDPMLIRKLICWRDPSGKPNQLEAEWKSGRKTPV